MEKFILCNFLGETIERNCKKGVLKVEVSHELTTNTQEAKTFISGENSNLTLHFVAEGEESRGKEFDFIGTFNTEDKKLKSKYGELVHTEENPLIVVATEKFKVFNGVPAYVKYMPVKGGVLVALIKGYIAVMGPDNTMIPLSRNCDDLANDVGHIFNAEDIQNMNSLPERESDILYSDYVVSDCIISIETSKDGRDLTSLRFSKNNFSYLYKEVFEEAKALKKEKAEKALEARRRKAEENAKFMEARRAREKDKEEEKRRNKDGAKKKSKKSEEKDTVESGFEGAKAFLAFVEQAKRGN